MLHRIPCRSHLTPFSAIRICLSIAFVLFAGFLRPAAAQPTNLAQYQTLAARCMGAAPDTLARFRLRAPDQMPYVRIALTTRWQSEGHTVFLSDTLTTLPKLQYEIEDTRVAYARGPNKTLRRDVTLGIRYMLTSAEGQLLHEQRCHDTLSDTISRADVNHVESPAFPETQATPPESGWLRRYLEPAVITAATAIGVYLLFSLRSDRADSGG